jgi:hypothetical protein
MEERERAKERKTADELAAMIRADLNADGGPKRALTRQRLRHPFARLVTFQATTSNLLAIRRQSST